MIAAADKVYLAVDSSKFGKKALSKICGLSEVDVIVTDEKPDGAWMDAFGIFCKICSNAFALRIIMGSPSVSR